MSGDSERIVNLSPLKRALIALEEMQGKLDAVERARTEPIAIVGVSCRFPGGADDPEAYWRLLRDGVDAIGDIPRERWDVDAYFDADPETPGKMYVRQGGFVGQVDGFEPGYFGISPREAVQMDPQQRLLLEVTWEALERAGQATDRLAGTRTGVFVGMMNTDYETLGAGDPTRIDPYYVTGNSQSIAAGRISYLLGLQGPAMAVDTACSSSLVALHLACQSLRARESDMALAGGVNLMLSPEATVASCKLRALAPDAHCKTFDARADGYARGEGCGVVVLKRLSDALAEGCEILAVIRGSAVNQDGRSNGLTAPSASAQEAVLRTALSNAGITPTEVGYVEAHGTGTSLGDPIEVRALGAVLGQGRRAEHPLVIGSAKTNLGHLEAAAGMAGLIKVALSLKHGEIPPHLNFQSLNPHISLKEIPAVIPTERRPWEPGRKRVAGVSAFGFSGTNAHVILEEAPAREPVPAKQDERPFHLLTLSSASEAGLKALARSYQGALAANPAAPLADMAFTTQVGRSHLEHRLAVVADSPALAAEQLADFLAGGESPGVVSGRVKKAKPKVAFLFTGAGSQYTGMGRQLFETEPVFRRALERCAELVRPYLEKPLLSVLFPEPGVASPLDEIAYTQPAMFALEWSLAELWRSWGVRPDVVMGHSVGELVAACVAGVFSLEDGLRLVTERGRLMQELSLDGEMVAINASEERVAEALAGHADQVSIAAINGPEDVVIAGASEAVRAVAGRFEAEGLKVKRLAISIASHSPMMEPMLDAFERVAASVTYAAPRLGLVSNVTGRRVQGREVSNPGYWRRHVREAVRFADGLRTLHEQGVELFLEVGPHPTLLGMGARCLPKEAGVWLPSLRKGQPDGQLLLASLGGLYARGVEADWRSMQDGRSRRLVTLPTVVWQRERYWVEPRTPAAAPALVERRSEGTRVHPLLGYRVRTSPLLKESLFEARLGLKSHPYMEDHRLHGAALLPASAFLELAQEAAARGLPSAGPVEELVIREPLVLPEEGTRTVQLLLSPEASGGATFQLISLGEGDAYTAHASGRIGTGAGAGTVAAPALAELQARCAEPVSLETFQAGLKARGLVLGPRFQGLHRLWKGQGEALGELRVPEALASETESYRVHPALLDACFQVVGATLLDGAAADEGGDMFLLMRVERFRLQGRSGAPSWSHATLQPGEAGEVRASVRLYAEDGTLVAEVEGLHLRRVSPEALRVTTRPTVEELFHAVRWEPRPIKEEAAPTAPGAWLLLVDEGGTGQRLAERLRARGERCVLVRAGASSGEVRGIDPARPEDFSRLVREVLGEGDSWRGVVSLWGLDAAAETSVDTLRTDLLKGTGGVLHLVRALTEQGAPTAPRLVLVTRGAQAVREGEAVSVTGGPVWGLARVLVHEHPELRCTRVDLGLADAPEELAALESELAREDAEPEVALRGSERLVPRLVREAPAKAEAPTFREDATYLLTGGLGGIGLEVARWLVKQGARSLVLVGRRGASAEAEPVLESLRQQGARITVAKVDVTRAEQVAELLADIQRTLPPLRGVLHTAAVIDDAMLGRLDWSRFQTVFGPKVEGAWNLHTLTRGLPMDFFVLFSSATALLGSPGVGNYMAANAFLDGLAYHRRAQGLPALSVDWGVWAGTGLALRSQYTDAQGQAKEGVGGFTPEQGLEALGRLMRANVTRSVVMAVDWAQWRNLSPAAAALPLVAHLLPEASASTRKSGEPSEVSKRLAEAAPEERLGLLAEHVRELVGRVLGLRASHTLASDQGFFDLGMDSLMAVNLKNRLEASLGCSIPTPTIFNHPTVDALTGHLARQVLALELSSSPVAEPPHLVKPEADASAVDEVRNLSDQEMEAFISDELSKLLA